jgi:hypothetical protein
MTGDISHTSFSENTIDWKKWSRMKEGYKINKMPRLFFKLMDPRLRERITVRYDVPDEDIADPTGEAPGSRVNVESEARYQRKCEEYEDHDKKYWSWINDRLAKGRLNQNNRISHRPLIYSSKKT